MNNLSNNPFVRHNSNEKKKLTQHAAKIATSTYRTKWIRDTQVPGFALRIEKTGSKSWTFGYRHKPTGKYRLHTIGTFNEDDRDDADNARALAEKMRLNLREGVYPTNFSEGQTIKDVVEYYLKGRQRTKNTGAHYWSARIVIPYVGDMTLDELDTPKVWRLRNDVIAVKEGANAAGFFIMYLKAAWNHALKFGFTKHPNPCAFVNGTTKRADKNPLDEEGYRAFWRGLENLSNMEQCSPFIPLALELLALSGNRRGEIAKIQLEHIDFGKGEIIIPEHKSNTNGEGTPLYIPCKEGSPVEKTVNKAISLRNQLDISIEDSPYLFPSVDQYGNVRRKYTVYRGMDWQWKRMQKLEPTLAETRMKDLRSSWATFAVNTLNISKQVVAAASGRADIGTMERHYLAVPDTYEAFNNIANGIAKLGDRSRRFSRELSPKV
jgi:integrase